MKVTIVKHKKDGSESVSLVEFSELLERMAHQEDALVRKYREAYVPMNGKVQDWYQLDKLTKVCPTSVYRKDRSGQKVWKASNGLVTLTVPQLNNALEISQVKREAALCPQTVCALTGADGHSVVILTQATLPNGTLPTEEHRAELFYAQAYATAVRCYAPTLQYVISIEEPTLNKGFHLTYDPEPYINAHPAPFIIEQPTENTLRQLESQGSMTPALERLKPSAETYVTLNHLFSNAFREAREELPHWNRDSKPEAMIYRVADKCALAGLPEEEVAHRLWFVFHQMDEQEVRGMVSNIYSTHKKIGTTPGMSKHQLTAFRLREFLTRRYEIRFNEVMQMTEFRPRQSMQFTFHELGDRELNTIHHEANLEGIEALFSEVKGLIHSTFVTRYNPIDDFLDNLPEWDGQDRMAEVARMVPCHNPHWERLFKQWFLSMVAHWMINDVEHANSTAPILIGAQGFRKSTFCRNLLPPELQMYFTDRIDFRTEIEAERTLSRFLLVNIDEFDQLSEKQFAFVKHLFQKPATNIRRMYSETIGTQRRYASFIGTSNHQEILKDPTGNRRYLCVEVTDYIHTEKPINYAQLYAQAKHLVSKGERYWLNDEDEALIKMANTDFEVETPLEQLFLTAFSKPEEGEQGGWLSPVFIMETLQKSPVFNRQRDNNLNLLGRLLTKLRVSKKRTKTGVMYYLKIR